MVMGVVTHKKGGGRPSCHPGPARADEGASTRHVLREPSCADGPDGRHVPTDGGKSVSFTAARAHAEQVHVREVECRAVMLSVGGGGEVDGVADV